MRRPPPRSVVGDSRGGRSFGDSDDRPVEVYREEALPGREEAQEQLRQILGGLLAQIRERGQWLARYIDGPARAGAPGRAVLIQDPEKARFYLRYGAEARTGFDRSWGAFREALELDRAEEADPIAVEAPATVPAEAPGPDLPAGDRMRERSAFVASGPQSSGEEITVFDDTNGSKTEPLTMAGPEAASPSLPVAERRRGRRRGGGRGGGGVGRISRRSHFGLGTAVKRRRARNFGRPEDPGIGPRRGDGWSGAGGDFQRHKSRGGSARSRDGGRDRGKGLCGRAERGVGPASWAY
jgi:hypothetical protein